MLTVANHSTHAYGCENPLVAKDILCSDCGPPAPWTATMYTLELVFFVYFEGINHLINY